VWRVLPFEELCPGWGLDRVFSLETGGLDTRQNLPMGWVEGAGGIVVAGHREFGRMRGKPDGSDWP
jgi:hypothetical protein